MQRSDASQLRKTNAQRSDARHGGDELAVDMAESTPMATTNDPPALQPRLSDAAAGSTAATTAAPADANRRPGAPKRVIPFRCGTFAPSSDTDVDEFLGRRGCLQRLTDWAGQLGRGETKGSRDERRAHGAAAVAASSSASPSAAAPAPAQPAAHLKPSVRQLRVSAYRRLRFGSNRIRSARYTVLNFLPLNLFEQMAPWRKPANFYFLCIAILQSINSISTTNGRPSILVPLCFVLAVTAVKDALEDYHRAKSDRAKNDAVYTVWRPEEGQSSGSGADGGSVGSVCSGRGAWLKEYSKDLLVGDLVRVEENKRIPADVLLVASGMAKGTHCFVDTKDLDGETNLKPKFVPTLLLRFLSNPASNAAAPAAASDTDSRGSASSDSDSAAAADGDDEASAAAASDAMLRRLERVSGSLECDPPNGNMSEFHGTLSIEPDGASASASASASRAQTQNLALDSLILSECVLRSTPWIVGLVVFTGDETKLRSNMKRQRQVRVKQTRVFSLTNRLFVFMALAQFVLCLSAAVACAVMQSRVQNDAFYLYFRDAAATAGVLQFFTWVILCKDFVPISLYVSMELVQFFQALFMGIDKSMSVQQIRVRNDDDEEDERDDGIEVVEEEEERQSSAGRKHFTGGFDAPAHSAPTSPPSDASQAGQTKGNGDKAAAGAAGAADAVVPSKRPRVVHETIYAKAQTSRLNDELSQVSYIFSDKTGTLTQNSMIFKKCVIGGRPYGRTSTQAGVIRRAKMEGRDVGAALANFEAERMRQERHRVKQGRSKFPHVEFDEADEVLAAMAGVNAAQAKDQAKDQTSVMIATPAAAVSPGRHSSAPSSSSSGRSHADQVREYLRALALNNSVFPKVDALRSGGPDVRAQRPAASSGSQSRAKSAPLYDLSSPATHAVMALESSSPDETALCYFAQFLGVELFSRSGGRTRLRIREGPPATVLAATTAVAPAAAEAVSRREQQKAEPAPASAPVAEAHFEDYLDVCMLDFSAKRKRMTVLVEPLDPHTGKPSGRILVYCKGADSFVYPLLAGAQQNGGAAAVAAGNDLSGSRQSQDDADDKTGSSAAAASAPAEPAAGADTPADWDATYEHLVEFGGESLRTLVIAGGEREHSWWFGPDGGDGGLKAEYERTQRSQGESEKGHVAGSCSSACAMCAIETRIEREAGMRLCGVTAIEDLLQEGVGVALRRLLDARIRIWVLTGDNVSTATNIAISCNLLEADMEREGRLFKLDRDDATSVAHIADVIREAQRTIAQMRAIDPATDFGLALHSDAWKMLYNAEDEPPTKTKEGGREKKTKTKSIAHTPAEVALQQSTLSAFFELTASCRSVIASRLEPREKAAIVEEMRRRTGLVCLAIGDGNNDEQMIRSADIGVGIRGVEGTSAVASSDYALCQFRHLTRLLLSYGHLHYRRMALLIQFIFYKSSTLVWTAFFFGSMSMFSAQSLYLDWTFQLFNIAYTSLGIIVVAVLDWDISMDTLEQHPLIYSATRGAPYFSPSSIARWLLAGLIDSALCFWLTWLSFGAWPAAAQPDQDVGFAAMGLVVYTCVCMVVNLKLAFFVRSWTWLHGLAFALSVAVYWCATLVFNATSFFAIGGIDYRGVLGFVARQPRFWLTLLLCLTSSAALTLLYLSVYELFWPRTPVQIYYEAALIGADMDQIDAQFAQIAARKEAAAGSALHGDDNGAQMQSKKAADIPAGSPEPDEEAQREPSTRGLPPVSALTLPSPQGAAEAAPPAATHPATSSPSAAPFSPVPLVGAVPVGSPQQAYGFLQGAGAAQAPLRVIEPIKTIDVAPLGHGSDASLNGQHAISPMQQAQCDAARAAPTAESQTNRPRRSSSLPTAYRYVAQPVSTREEAAASTSLALPGQDAAGRDLQFDSGRARSGSAPAARPTPLPPLQLHLGELTPRAAYSGFAFSHTPTGKLWAVQMQRRHRDRDARDPSAHLPVAQPQRADDFDIKAAPPVCAPAQRDVDDNAQY